MKIPGRYKIINTSVNTPFFGAWHCPYLIITLFLYLPPKMKIHPLITKNCVLKPMM